jgi:hypothetical protein
MVSSRETGVDPIQCDVAASPSTDCTTSEWGRVSFPPQLSSATSALGCAHVATMTANVVFSPMLTGMDVEKVEIFTLIFQGVADLSSILKEKRKDGCGKVEGVIRKLKAICGLFLIWNFKR